jgi:uncharacterized OsmC-like protein
MYGNFRGALVARKVEFDPDTLAANVEGTIEALNGGTIRITKIHVLYRVDFPAEQRGLADRALAVHASACPAHESVKDSIEVTWAADIRERAG